MALTGELLHTSLTAVATAEGKYVLVPFGTSVNVYRASTGGRVQQLHGHTRLVSGICLHPSNTFQAITSSLDGKICLWDVADGLLVKTFDLGKPIHAIVVPRGQSVLYYEVTKRAGEKNRPSHAAVKVFSIEAWKSLDPVLTLNNSFAALAASESGEYVGAADGRRLLLWPVAKGWKTPLKLYHTKNLTCLAITAGGGKVSAGDCTGRILIWHGLQAAVTQAESGTEGGTISCTTVHWHAGPVRCLAFNLDSTYLLSGGDEAVLVAWQLGSNSRRTLPRLNGQLMGITPLLNDAALFLVTQRDNTVRIVNLASMKLIFSIHGLRRHPHKLPDQSIDQSAVAMLPGGGELVIAGDSTILQFYDASKDRHIDKIQVRPVNAMVSYDEGESRPGKFAFTPPVEPQVRFIGFNADGSRMATVDVRPDIDHPESVYQSTLRFWERRPSGAPADDSPLFSVQIEYDQPHREKVTGLAYHPSQDIVASVSLDGEIKTWQLLNDSDRKRRSWQCTASTSYQDQAMHSVAFSSDGSLIAVGTGSCVTLWNSGDGSYVASLAGALSLEDESFPLLAFVSGTPFLAGSMKGSKDGLVVWNILTASVWWWLPIPVTCLAADSLGTGGLAVGIRPAGGVHKQEGNAAGSVALFNAASQEPIQVWYLPQSWASSLFFPPPSSPLFAEGIKVAPEGTSPLLILCHDRRYCLGRKRGAAIPQQYFEADTDEVKDDLGLSAFVKDKQATGETKDTSIFDTNPSTQKKIATLLDAPSHALPPMRVLAPAFLELLICDSASKSTRTD